MDDTDLPLLVSVHAISDYFTCSICMNKMSGTIMTNCGHRFCEMCIREWVDRKHTCPCCNKNLTTAQLFKDHQFDSLISTIVAEKGKAEEKYFDSLINSAASCVKEDNTNLSPIETVLKNHLRKSLAAHEMYLQRLRNELEKKHQKLESECNQSIRELQLHGLSQTELDQQTSDLKGTLSRHQDSLQEELSVCTKLISEAYDKHLTNHIPKLDVLPVKVTVNFLEKDIKISDLTLLPTDIAKERVISAVNGTMKARGNPVLKWADDILFVLFGPFAKCSQREMKQMIADMLDQGKDYPDVHILSEDTRPVIQYGIKPNSEIVIYGNVKCKSDLPKQCFTKTFQNEKNQIMDYFYCADCAFKWICRCCMEVCHKGHHIKPYIMGHKPEWACCYCPRKKKCVFDATS